MDDFSWTDGVRAAVSACLPCFTSNERGSPSDDSVQSENEVRVSRPSQTHYDELEGLLGDVNDTDADAETMSLHSNVGEGRRRRQKKNKKRRGPTRSIRLFGLNLFGRPPIQLSDSEHDDEVSDRGDVAAQRSRLGRLSSAHSSSSVSAFDSDASPLDAAVIAQLTAQDAAARAEHEATLHAAEEQRRREEREDKEERRRRRRERRELKRISQTLAKNGGVIGDSEAFEGFQGSGQLPPLYNTDSRAKFGSESRSAMTSPGISTAHVEFGPFVEGTRPSRSGNELADGEADFGGEAYTRKALSRRSDSSRSHTHSQTSASHSQSHTNSNSSSSRYHYFSQGSPLPPHSTLSPGAGFQAVNIANMPASSNGPLNLTEVSHKKRSKNSSASQSIGRKSTISPTSTSASLPSVDPASPVRATFAPVEPYIVEHDSESGAGALPVSPGVSAFTFGGALQNEGKFPSTGLGGVRRTNSSGSGVFLARRGED